MLDDAELLAAYTSERSETAFAALVERHVALVYSSALRQVGNPHLAEEITQAVFIILARKADRLKSETILAGWLCRTAHLAACNARKAEQRRQQRETEAHMNSLLNEPDPDAWPQIAPLLDEAVAQLSEADRNSIVLRFYQQKPLEEVGHALGLSADAAHKRVSRALEKLRKIFSKRGLTLTATVIASAVAANSVQAAPVGLAVTVTAAAAKGAAIGGSTLTIIKGALKLMAWTKTQTVVVIGVGVLLAISTTTVVIREIKKENLSWADDQRIWAMAWSEQDLTVRQKIPPAAVLIRPTRFPDKHSNLDSDYLILGNDASITNILDAAYKSFQPREVIMPANIPQGRYDYLLRGDHLLTPAQRKPLQDEIKKQFGLVAHTEMRNTDVLLLEVKVSNHTGIKPGTDPHTGSIYTARSFKKDETEIRNARLGNWASMLNDYCDLPVLDRTGLTGSYDLFIRWKSDGGDKKVEREIINGALLDQLGLELVPSRAPMEMLVVEKVN